MTAARRAVPLVFSIAVAALSAPRPAGAAIRRDPNGVNVNASGGTSVFITFGGLSGQRPAEAFWCGELVPAAPDLGQKCDPATVFGRLPLRYDQSRAVGSSVFHDVMSIPPSVARRAYQAAQQGARSSFFYVRRFVSVTGGPDEYVFVTCRMAGGGARVPFSLTDVRLRYTGGANVALVAPGAAPPPFEAEIAYNGTGRLAGRWEVVQPGDELPRPDDLVTEATLPPGERPFQRRYTQVQRFNVFLPPTGSFVLPGPDVARLPSATDGQYLVLLRVEASDDKEGDSNLALAGAGQGIVHSGAVAGFPLPVLRYLVGAAGTSADEGDVRLRLLTPEERAEVAAASSVPFRWVDSLPAAMVRLAVEDLDGAPVFAALVPPGLGAYAAPPWLAEKAAEGYLRWRIEALDPQGRVSSRTGWRTLRVRSRALNRAASGTLDARMRTGRWRWTE